MPSGNWILFSLHGYIISNTKLYQGLYIFKLTAWCYFFFVFKQPNYGAKSVPIRDHGFLVQVGENAWWVLQTWRRLSCLLIILSRLYYSLFCCSQTIEFAEQRIPVLNEYCVVCDEPHVFQNGPMLRVSSINFTINYVIWFDMSACAPLRNLQGRIE